MSVWHNRQVGSTQGGGPALVTFEVQLDSGEWVGIADAILHAPGGASVQMAGRQTELARIDNGTLRLVLLNDGGDYTPGSSTAAVPLKQGMPIRGTETVGRRSWELFRGTLQQPEAVYGATPNDAHVVVSAVDALGALASDGRTFISTLGEYIRHRGGSALIGYWPMGEPGDATQAESAVSGQGALAIERRHAGASEGRAPANSLLRFGGADGPLADDISGVQFNPVTSATSIAVRDRLVTRELSGATFTGAGAVAVSLWYRPTNEFAGSWQAMVAKNVANNTSFTLQADGGTNWNSYVTTNGGFAILTGGAPTWGHWQLLTVHLVVATGAVSLWIDGTQEYTDSLGGASTGGFDSILVDAGSPGAAAAHLQLYIGTTAELTRQLHLDQYAHGTDDMFGGLRWQRTDERIQTLCDYAGIAARRIDYGTSWMGRASLAGKSFATAAAEAVDTERGRLFVDAAGNTTFHSRVRATYNV